MNDVFLVRETSNILLQASSIAIDDVRNDISQASTWSLLMIQEQ